MCLNAQFPDEALEIQLRELLRGAVSLAHQASRTRNQNNHDEYLRLKRQSEQYIVDAFASVRNSDRLCCPANISSERYDELLDCTLAFLHRKFRQHTQHSSIIAWFNQIICLIWVVEQALDSLQARGELWQPDDLDQWYYNIICDRVRNFLYQFILRRLAAQPPREIPTQDELEWLINERFERMYDELDRNLCHLIEQACDPKRSLTERRRTRNQIVREMQASGRISRRPLSSHYDPEIYNDALQETWRWFFEILCGNSCCGYNPRLAGVITYFNTKLHYVYLEIMAQRPIQPPEPPIELPPEPPIEPLAEAIIEAVIRYAEADESGVMRSTFMRRTTISCQFLILRVFRELRPPSRGFVGFVELIERLVQERNSRSWRRLWLDFWQTSIQPIANELEVEFEKLWNFWVNSCLPFVHRYFDEQ